MNLVSRYEFNITKKLSKLQITLTQSIADVRNCARQLYKTLKTTVKKYVVSFPFYNEEIKIQRREHLISGGSRICCQVCLVHAFPITPYCFLGKKSLGEPLHMNFPNFRGSQNFSDPHNSTHVEASFFTFLLNSWSLPLKSNLFKRTE